MDFVTNTTEIQGIIRTIICYKPDNLEETDEVLELGRKIGFPVPSSHNHLTSKMLFYHSEYFLMPFFFQAWVQQTRDMGLCPIIFIRCDIHYEVKVIQSCPTLYDTMDCSLTGFSVHWILLARTPEWVAIHFFRGSSQPSSPALQVHSLPALWPGKPKISIYINILIIDMINAMKKMHSPESHHRIVFYSQIATHMYFLWSFCVNLSLLSMLFRIYFCVYIYIQETIILNFIKS